MLTLKLFSVIEDHEQLVTFSLVWNISFLSRTH